jgi:hypothetical protein
MDIDKLEFQKQDDGTTIATETKCADGWEMNTECPICHRVHGTVGGYYYRDPIMCPKCGTPRPTHGWPRAAWRSITTITYKVLPDPLGESKTPLLKARALLWWIFASSKWTPVGKNVVANTGEHRHRWERKPGIIPAEGEACPYCGGDTCPRCGGPLHG